MRHRIARVAVLLVLAVASRAEAGVPPNGPSLTFSPAGGTIISGSNITITAQGGQPGASTSYSCVVPPGFTVTQASGAMTTGDSARTLNASCPPGPDASMTCTVSGLAPAVHQYLIDCPANFAFTTANPPPGALECNGAPGTLPRIAVNFVSFHSTVAGFQCSVAGSGFSIVTTPAASIPSGNATLVEVACDPPPFGQPARMGTLQCTGMGAGAFAYTLSSLGLATGAPTHPVVVPATARAMLGTLVALFALVAMAAFRRRD